MKYDAKQIKAEAARIARIFAECMTADEATRLEAEMAARRAAKKVTS